MAPLETALRRSYLDEGKPDIDVVAWECKHAFTMLVGHNLTLLEAFTSPLVYTLSVGMGVGEGQGKGGGACADVGKGGDGERDSGTRAAADNANDEGLTTWVDEVRTLVRERFHRIRLARCAWSQAFSNYRQYIKTKEDGEVVQKKYIHVARKIMLAAWLIRNDNESSDGGNDNNDGTAGGVDGHWGHGDSGAGGSKGGCDGGGTEGGALGGKEGEGGGVDGEGRTGGGRGRGGAWPPPVVVRELLDAYPSLQPPSPITGGGDGETDASHVGGGGVGSGGIGGGGAVHGSGCGGGDGGGSGSGDDGCVGDGGGAGDMHQHRGIGIGDDARAVLEGLLAPGPQRSQLAVPGPRRAVLDAWVESQLQALKRPVGWEGGEHRVVKVAGGGGGGGGGSGGGGGGGGGCGAEDDVDGNGRDGGGGGDGSKSMVVVATEDANAAVDGGGDGGDGGDSSGQTFGPNGGPSGGRKKKTKKKRKEPGPRKHKRGVGKEAEAARLAEVAVWDAVLVPLLRRATG